MIRFFSFLLLLPLGCSLDQKIDELKTTGVETIKAALIENTSGRDINEPITGWILAIGLIAILLSVSVGFFIYLISNRIPFVRKIKDRLKGKTCVS
jgi:hypothetical protein